MSGLRVYRILSDRFRDEHIILRSLSVRDPKNGIYLFDDLETIITDEKTIESGKLYLGILSSSKFKITIKIGTDKKSLMREYLLGCKLSQPEFSQPIAFFKLKGKREVGIIFKQIEGVTLYELITTNKIDFGEYLNIYLQILFILENAQRLHRFGHFDLHLRNIMIVRNTKDTVEKSYIFDDKIYTLKPGKYTPVIIDMGTACIKSSGSSDFIRYGMMPYLVPGFDMYKLLFYSYLYSSGNLQTEIRGMFNFYPEKTDPYHILSATDTEIDIAREEYVGRITNSDVVNYIPIDFVDWIYSFGNSDLTVRDRDRLRLENRYSDHKSDNKIYKIDKDTSYAHALYIAHITGIEINIDKERCMKVDKRILQIPLLKRPDKRILPYLQYYYIIKELGLTGEHFYESYISKIEILGYASYSRHLERDIRMKELKRKMKFIKTTGEKKEKTMMISQPAELKKSLYPHQLSSVFRMEEVEREQMLNGMKTDMAISADKTGYGKTLSMVALVLRDKMPWNLEEKHYVDRTYSFADGHVSKTYRSPYTRNNITLILCNVSIIDQWVREFENTPLIVGRISNGRELDELISEGDVSDLDVLIVVPSMFNTIVEMYRGDAWKRFIFDEPGHIRVPAMIHVVAGFYWFVTATPELVYNTHFRCNKSYMKTLFREIGSGGDLLNNLSIRNDEKFLEESFVMPQTSHKYYNCFTQMRGIFRGLVHGRIQEMIDADNIEGVIAALGGNQTSNIADLVRKRKLEEQEEISSKVRIYTLRGDDEKVTEWKEKLVSINAQIEMLDSRFKDMLSSDCVICFENLKNPIMEAHCNNIFCGACILKWIAENRTCPMCRWTVEEKELVYIETDPEKKIQKKKKTKKIKTKEETLIKIIKSRPDGKFIIFSMWDGTFSRIVSLLDENKISHIEIKGPAAVIAHRLNMFREGRVQAVLLNTQHNGSGINLQETTDIILYHTMSDHYTAQAIGRANRIGRTIPLTVHHLLYDDESIPE